MTSSSLTALNPSSRSLEWLVGSSALLSSTALSTGQLTSLGPIASLVESAVDVGAADAGGSLLPDALTDTANRIVLDTHAQLENTGHEIAALNGPLHGLTNLGETVGLGHIGEAGNLITDLSGAVASPTDAGGLVPVLSDAAQVAEAAGTLLNTVTALPVAGNGLVGSGGTLTPAAGILNQAVLDLHTTLEDVGHQIPVLNTPIHALTGLGETVGLGHIGAAGNLLTDTLAVPGSILSGGGLASASPVLTDLGPVLGATDTLITAVTGAATAGGLLSSGGLLAPVTNLANTAVLDVHMTLENLGHEIPLLNDAVHGLTNLGETIGLGHLGQGGNLLTDAAALPGALLGGQGLGALSPVLGDVGAVAGAAGGLLGGVTGIVGDLGGAGAPGTGSLLAPVTAAVDGLLGGLNGGTGSGATGALLGTNAPLQPVGDVANTLIDGVHAGLEQVGHDVPILNGPLHAVIGLGNTVGLGELGDTHNLLTDTINLPGALLTGNGPAGVAQVVGDLGHVADALGGVVGSATGLLDTAGGGLGSGLPGGGLLAPVTSALGGLTGDQGTGALDGLLGGLNGGTGSGATGALLGPSAPLQPVGDVANTLIDGVHAGLEQVGHDVPALNDPLHAVINLGTAVGLGELGESSNLVTDIVNLPGAVLAGDGGPAVAQVASDLGSVTDAAGSVLGSVAGILPAAGGDGHPTGTPVDGVVATVATVLGAGDTGAAGGAVGNLLGNLTGNTSGEAGAGTHPLIDVSAGPTTATPVADVAVLTPSADPAHAVEVSAIAVSADQPSLATANLLGSDSIHLPQTGGGADSLVGHLADAVSATSAAPAGAGASQGVSVDLGIATIDLGGHTEVQHTDPTPHTATSGLHLLGL
ncbi:hypothetical protein LOK46_30245 (plasmid) [Methylobacterium sp. NMS14P]|uniref:hypothetical protein n=1 Tax=Methylobacterium sp. NMS14P TaxID=2894310 RepID=UPI0023598C96|nr:hypothetical protein [Methylobacterium sp. NMS14P]WCS28675.1 hypothetical protein LOK46_30245 [Methylobacterium sp. NMS14P]